MKNIKIISFILILIIGMGCEKEEENNIFINLELVSSETFEINNTNFDIYVYGYDSSFQNAPATLIAQHTFRSTQLPIILKMEIPENAVELIEYIDDKNDARFYTYINWDSDNNGIICNGDITIDNSNNFQNINIDTTKIQTINLVKIESIQCEIQPYIKNLILPHTPNPYKGEYYIRADFINVATSERKELFFNAGEHQLSNVFSSSFGMSAKGISFKDTLTNEELEISFYYNDNEHSTFNFRRANYYFADPWRNIAGASIEFFTPDINIEPDSRYRYLGSSGSEYYFEIRYMDNNRLNGVFKTEWKECCGGSIVYDVIGDFSIPR